MIQASLVAKLLTSSIETTAIQVVPRKCLRSRLNSYPCTLCVDLCPNNALSLVGNTITVSEERCRGCMLCSTICPNDSLSSSVDIRFLLIDNLPDAETVTFTCKLQQQYIDGEVVLPCLATLPGEALLYLCLVEKSSPILFNARHCSTCHNNKSFQIFKEIFEAVSHLTRELANSSLVLQTQENDKPEQTTRRVFLKSIKNVISSQNQNRHKARAGDRQSNPCNRTIPKRIELIKAATALIPPSQQDLLSKQLKSRVTVNGPCTPCNRCSGICPTGALESIKSNEKKKLTFDSEKCSGCGLCVVFCKHEALSLTASPISRLPLNLM